MDAEHAAHQALTWCGIFANNNEYLNFQPNEFGFFGAYTGTEDCLVLNIHVPSHAFNNNDPLAVMVFIHGGGFVMGSGLPSLYGPEYLLDEDVVRK